MAENHPRRGDSRPRPVNLAHGSSGADTGWAITGTMLSGMAVWGGAGWLLDRWLDITVLLPVGIILGMAVAIYVVVVKYGGASPTPWKRRASTTTGGQPHDQGGPTRTQKGQR